MGDVKEEGLDQEHPPEVYIPHAQMPVNAMDVVLRTPWTRCRWRAAVEKAVAGLDPELPVARLQTLDEIVARSVSEPRFYMVLLGAFAAMAVLLAALGIFGVMSYAVVQRSREIGIRVALGARPARRPGHGHAAGVPAHRRRRRAGPAGRACLSRVMASLLFELSPTDPADAGQRRPGASRRWRSWPATCPPAARRAWIP